jgi:Ca-activated chloride channel family protein
MKSALLLLLFITTALTAFANGVGVVNASTGIYLSLTKSEINVNVENQVAVITTAQTFKNNLGFSTNFKYSFPMPEGASATQLRWFINGSWQTAIIDAQPQDTTLPGGGSIHPNLENYLGDLPLNFDIDEQIEFDSSVIIELTYVELLEYEFGNVFFNYKNDYSLIQWTPLVLQSFQFNLTSGRTIEDIQLTSHNPTTLANNSQTAFVSCLIENEAADEDYKIIYTLNSEELGLFSFSTFQIDSVVPDELGNGFFTFVAEPDPSEVTDVINKVFTLIIDRSGSMSGNKIVQAKNAAEYIVNNLNEGDRFNIVDFESNVFSFRNGHVPYDIVNRDAALSYISAIQAGGGTNISGAFSTAVPQFSASNDSTANIIVFFTDGEATAGITSTNGILTHVQNLVNQNESDIIIFTFGIGSYVNEQLLTLLAAQNNGISEFLGDDELEEVITQFYQTIRNPVLLNTQISFSDSSVTEIFPDPASKFI